ncbi:MAG TPA: amino acid ABC transporter permease [Candidatus Baltobacteraceae bacterium]|jgi:His/Glu/Gln/Arg/opine family amino acid ABC transporter permease subunit|nr:amino acid ABC transporter permease [Candidatus Baltobacteraceae bacterium]
MNYDWHFERLSPYWGAFVVGTETTLSLTICVVICGSLFGLICGFALRQPPIRWFLYPIIDIIRALPPLVFLLFVYYILTQQIIGIAIPAYWVYVIAMSLNLAAFTADIVRAAIENVPQDAADAGRALGMSEKQLARYIILPHVTREVIPTMSLLYISMLKMSSLASVINVREVVYAAQTVIAENSRSLESWCIVGAIYVSLVMPFTYIARKLEIWSGRGTSQASHE